MIGKRIGRIWLLVLLAFLSCAQAGQERYDYDALGRLVRFINPAGEGTEYVYDAVGNIQAVRQVQVSPPRITGVSPTAVRRGARTSLFVTGTDLLWTTVTTTVPGVHVDGRGSTESEASFDLTVDETAPLGAQPFVLASATGSTGFHLTILPVMPRLSVSPSPVVLPLAATLTLTFTLSRPEDQAHEMAFTPNSAVAVSADTLHFPAGQTTTSATLTALAPGTTLLELTSATLAGAKVSIFVAAPLGPGERQGLSAEVGVVREPPALTEPRGPFIAPAVGVIRQPPFLSEPRGPFIAPAVGVIRLPPSLSEPRGPFAAPAVGVVREPPALAEPIGPLVSPAVGVDKSAP